MRFLLTGASGFIGTHLTRLLTRRGHPVRALVRERSRRQALAQAGATFAVGEITTGAGLDAALQEVDCVIHLAGLTKARSLDAFFRCNAEGTRRLAEAVHRMERPARLIYCSSLSAAGPTTLGRPKVEADEPRPISSYGRSKLAGEIALRQYVDRVPCVIVRPPVVYGPEEKALVPSLLPMAKLGVFLKSGVRPKAFSVVYIDDLCEGLYAAALRGQPLEPGTPGRGIYFLTDGRAEHRWEEVCHSVAQAVGRQRTVIVPIPESLSLAVGLCAEVWAQLRGTVATVNLDKVAELHSEAWTCSTEQARRELGYEPRMPLTQGMANTLAWFRQEGHL
jgi:dihydroflavonol-4-reductase